MPRLRVFFLALAAVLSCSDEPTPVTPKSLLRPGELCEKTSIPTRLRFDPPSIVLGPGTSRPVKMTLEPDACDPVEAQFVTLDTNIANGPIRARFDLRRPTFDFQVRGLALGRTTITASMPGKNDREEDAIVSATLDVDVRDPVPPSCSPGGDVAVAVVDGAASTIRGAGALAKSALFVRPEAFTRTDEFAMSPFPARVECGSDLANALPNARLRKLGPAVTFAAEFPGAMTKPLRREVDFTIPVNPATFPPSARLRHLHVLYRGPRVHVPRVVLVSNPRIVPDGDGGYVFKFSSPWFGTYQAVVEESAGEKRRMRRLTHRAVMGFSMGGGGAAIFGMRHHDKFDVVAPLGGPSDWTWLLHYIRDYALGGFCPVGQTCPTTPPNRYPMDEPYGHTQDFDHWFYEVGEGNGGSFPRSDTVQIFEDLALAMGNPNGWNADPKLPHLAGGPKSVDPWATKDGTDCTFGVDPIDKDPNNERQREREEACRAHRCNPANIWKAESRYFDDEFNPDGGKQVISFCDGAQQDRNASPHSNTYKVGGNKPVNMALAVDLNGNGVRDPGEPIIRAGHEPFLDCGTDRLCDPDEPGYDAITNPDPNQDDYDYTLNPSGLEGNHRYDPGERFDDFGLDGVPNTAALHVAGDPGENDNVYTEAPGLAAFYRNDPHAMISRRETRIPAGAVTDDALRRLSILADGGVRDLFNFAVVASHLMGQVHGRRSENGLPIRSVASYNSFQLLPGQDETSDNFAPFDLRWADIADMPNMRYGDLDASAARIKNGDGQHVGTPNQILNRLMLAYFYVAQQWPDADRRQTIASRENGWPGSKECEFVGTCKHVFEGPVTKRVGPISVSLPPGYALKENVERNVRYPVLYVLHGYGQTPDQLEALAIFTNNFMNLAQRSSATRLPKFITVYVDGRCREPNGKPECIRGTFYMDSERADGPKIDGWFDEVMTFMDQNYRTMGPSEVEVTD